MLAKLYHSGFVQELIPHVTCHTTYLTEIWFILDYCHRTNYYTLMLPLPHCSAAFYQALLASISERYNTLPYFSIYPPFFCALRLYLWLAPWLPFQCSSSGASRLGRCRRRPPGRGLGTAGREQGDSGDRGTGTARTAGQGGRLGQGDSTGCPARLRPAVPRSALQSPQGRARRSRRAPAAERGAPLHSTVRVSGERKGRENCCCSNCPSV